jgi:hypothetical protein
MFSPRAALYRLVFVIPLLYGLSPGDSIEAVHWGVCSAIGFGTRTDPLIGRRRAQRLRLPLQSKDWRMPLPSATRLRLRVSAWHVQVEVKSPRVSSAVYCLARCLVLSNSQNVAAFLPLCPSGNC